MNLKEKITEMWHSKPVEDLKDKLEGAVVLAGGYLALTIAVNAAYYGLSAGYESIQNKEQRTIQAKVVQIGVSKLPHFPEYKHALIACDTDTLKVFDNIRVLEGNWIQNKHINGLEEGKEYTFSLVGNKKIGFDIVDVQ